MRSMVLSEIALTVWLVLTPVGSQLILSAFASDVSLQHQTFNMDLCISPTLCPRSPRPSLLQGYVVTPFQHTRFIKGLIALSDSWTHPMEADTCFDFSHSS